MYCVSLLKDLRNFLYVHTLFILSCSNNQSCTPFSIFISKMGCVTCNSRIDWTRDCDQVADKERKVLQRSGTRLIKSTATRSCKYRHLQHPYRSRIMDNRIG